MTESSNGASCARRDDAARGELWVVSMAMLRLSWGLTTFHAHRAEGVRCAGQDRVRAVRTSHLRSGETMRRTEQSTRPRLSAKTRRAMRRRFKMLRKFVSFRRRVPRRERSEKENRGQRLFRPAPTICCVNDLLRLRFLAHHAPMTRASHASLHSTRSIHSVRFADHQVLIQAMAHTLNRVAFDESPETSPTRCPYTLLRRDPSWRPRNALLSADRSHKLLTGRTPNLHKRSVGGMYARAARKERL